MTESLLRPAAFSVPAETAEIPPLPRETLAEAHANAFAWMNVRAVTSQDLRKAVSDLERFTGEIGELNHFLKGGDRLMARIDAKFGEQLLDLVDANSIKADLICRIKRSVLNLIQADEETPWVIIKDRLKKAYGGGRWTPEEDIFQMFRERKQPRQSNGQYAGGLLARFNKITEKMRETAAAVEVEAKMAFLATILKVQLARETGKKDGFARDRSFIECAQELVDASARDEEVRMEIDEPGWSRVTYRKPRVMSGSWRRRREADYDGRERVAVEGRRQEQRKPRPAGRRDDRRCHGCGKTGHLVAQCPRTKCYECGNEGHIAKQCPYLYQRRDTRRDEPMEVNAQRVWRRNRTSSVSTRSSGSSESDGEADAPGSSRGVGGRSRHETGRWRVAAEKRDLPEA